MKNKRWVIPLFAILCAAAINLFLIVNAHIPSESMTPTIDNGSFVIGSKLAYLTAEPKVGDIVFFKKEDISSSLLIKRIIATPGMTFSMKDGRVYINGELLNEEYITDFGGSNFDEITVPDDCFILLGDNRTESNDSRYWDDPFVKRKDIKAKATFIWFPKFKLI